MLKSMKCYEIFTAKHMLLQFRRHLNISQFLCSGLREDDIRTPLDEKNSEIDELIHKCFGSMRDHHNCFVVNPHVKWGARKMHETTADSRLAEAVALIRTLPTWSVAGQRSLPAENLDKALIFGSGNLKTLQAEVRAIGGLDAVFINKGMLKVDQTKELEKVFGVKVYDRYKIVLEILRLHASSKLVLLQIALAEIPYLRHHISPKDVTKRRRLMQRETALKDSVKLFREQRHLLRKKRLSMEFPVVSVVGYTNCGKTSLIKLLTGDKMLLPKDQLFATLDVTVHAGMLPCRLKVLFVDTVGFISDIPTNLLECFTATLEDVVYSDVIIHLHDVSSPDFLHQRKHVLETLKSLAAKSPDVDFEKKLLSVGNKIDLVKDLHGFEQYVQRFISSRTEEGLDELVKCIQDMIFQVTEWRALTIKVPNGGDELRWLYKNAAVSNVAADHHDSSSVLVNLVITRAKLNIFKATFKFAMVLFTLKTIFVTSEKNKDRRRENKKEGRYLIKVHIDYYGHSHHVQILYFNTSKAIRARISVQKISIGTWTKCKVLGLTKQQSKLKNAVKGLRERKNWDSMV